MPKVITSILAGFLSWGAFAQHLDPGSEILALPSTIQRDWISLKETDEKPEQTKLIAWIELLKQDKTTYWALKLQLDENDIESETVSLGTLYTSTGRSFSFRSSKSQLKAQLTGPLKATKIARSRVKNYELAVNRDYLSLGMHRVHDFFEAGRKYRAIVGLEQPVSYSIASNPIDDPELLLSEEMIAGMGLTEEAERAFVGVLPSLTEFFNIVMETDGLKDILLELIPKSSLVGLLNPFGSSGIGIRFAQKETSIGRCDNFLPEGQKACSIPVSIDVNGKPTVEIVLFAIAPEGPWKASAGIVAVKAKSLAFSDRSVFIRVQKL